MSDWKLYLPDKYKDKPIDSYGTITPKVIVIHMTTGDKDDGSDAVAYMFSRNDGVRWHWTMGDDGTAWKHGEFTDMMAGARGINDINVSIEHDMPMGSNPSLEMMWQSAQVVAAFCHFIGRKPSRDFIIRHGEDSSTTREEEKGNDWTDWGGTSTHTDPSKSWPWQTYMDLVWGAYSGGKMYLKFKDGWKAFVTRMRELNADPGPAPEGRDPDWSFGWTAARFSWQNPVCEGGEFPTEFDVTGHLKVA